MSSEKRPDGKGRGDKNGGGQARDPGRAGRRETRLYFSRSMWYISGMAWKQFRSPVRVQLGRIDRDRIVTGPRDAAEILLRVWPIEESVKRTKAMQACLEVIKGEAPPSTARNAFIAAAKEARVFLDG